MGFNIYDGTCACLDCVRNFKQTEMIQTKEELFLAELGVDVNVNVQLFYSESIKLTELLKAYESELILNKTEQPKYRIKNIKSGEGEFRSKILSAEVVYISDGKLKCSATLDFILTVMYPQRDIIENFEEAFGIYVKFNQEIIDTHFKK